MIELGMNEQEVLGIKLLILNQTKKNLVQKVKMKPIFLLVPFVTALLNNDTGENGETNEYKICSVIRFKLLLRTRKQYKLWRL